jgi:hypothetical protein
MSIIQVVDNDYVTEAPVGCTVVFDNKKVRCFDETKDNPISIIGVAYSKDAIYGREVVNGLVFYENDTYLMDDFFNYKKDEYGEYIYNTKEPKVDPWQDPDCVFIATHGLVPVLKGEPTHPNWIIYDTEYSTITDVWWIR